MIAPISANMSHDDLLTSLEQDISFDGSPTGVGAGVEFGEVGAGVEFGGDDEGAFDGTLVGFSVGLGVGLATGGEVGVEGYEISHLPLQDPSQRSLLSWHQTLFG